MQYAFILILFGHPTFYRTAIYDFIYKLFMIAFVISLYVTILIANTTYALTLSIHDEVDNIYYWQLA